jgi:hypothetical protein
MPPSITSSPLHERPSIQTSHSFSIAHRVRTTGEVAIAIVSCVEVASLNLASTECILKTNPG